MNFEELVNFKKKINSTLNIFDWFDEMNNTHDAKSNSLLFSLKLGIFFYFIFLIFLFHFIYRLFKKQFLRSKYFKMLSIFVDQNGHDISYWRSKVNEKIKQDQRDFYQKIKSKQEMDDNDF